MNDLELEAKLKQVSLPKRTEEYWNDFPAQVSWQLSRRLSQPGVRAGWLPQLAWKVGTGFASGLVGLVILSQPLKAASGAIFQQEQFVRQHLTALPGQLRVLMADEHGLHYLVAEKE